jgi:predicted nucleic acid-binding protein
MHPVLFDTSIYISVLRSNVDAAGYLRRAAAGAPIWLSAVVLEELYAGALGRAKRVVERLERDFDRVNRILVPNNTDWTQTGKTLARLASKYDYEQIGRARLTNDALIAASAGRLGITVISSNLGDYAQLAKFLRFAWRVESVAP